MHVQVIHSGSNDQFLGIVLMLRRNWVVRDLHGRNGMPLSIKLLGFLLLLASPVDPVTINNKTLHVGSANKRKQQCGCCLVILYHYKNVFTPTIIETSAIGHSGHRISLVLQWLQSHR